MEKSIFEENKKLMNEKLQMLEKKLDADVLVYYGEIIQGADDRIKDIIEDLKKDLVVHERLFVILTTPGGSINPVKRMVAVFRHFYKEVNFIIPDFAFSAGTILCMSGDNIYMNYYSALGPIDPQVQNRDGKLVAALGYLDKINEMIEKSRRGELTQAEFLVLKDFDLAELRAYEQAKALAVDLVMEWLEKYKFKDWNEHKDGRKVSLQEKQERAKEIADKLSNNNIWKSHSRPISISELEAMYLKISDYEKDIELSEIITAYYGMMRNYIQINQFRLFMHTRRFL